MCRNCDSTQSQILLFYVAKLTESHLANRAADISCTTRDTRNSFLAGSTNLRKEMQLQLLADFF